MSLRCFSRTSGDDEVAGCSGKAAFANPTQAWRVARRQARKRNKERLIYRCKFCGRWHQGRANNV